MHPFTVMVSALAVLVGASVAAGRTGNPARKKWLEAAAGAAAMVVLGCVAAGLWSAWSPWDLELVKR